MASLEPSEAEWNEYGAMFASSRFATRVVRVALWAIQAFMAIDGVSKYVKMPKERRKGYLQPIVFSGVILVASGICLVLDVWVVFNNLFKAGPTGISYIEAYRNDSAGDSSHNVVMILSSVTGDVTIAAGDILLLWRCYIVWSSRRWVVVLPSLACAGSIISRIVCLVMMSKRSYIVEGLVAVVSMTAESLSVSTNVAVTGLIVFRLAGASRMASRLRPSMKRSGTYSNVAAMIIESAAPLAIFGICYIIVTAIAYYHYPETLSQQGRVNTLSEVSGSLYVAFSALSPQMIIYRVLNGQSWKNAHESNELTEKLSTTLRFATPRSGSPDVIDAEGAHPVTKG